MHGLRTEVVRTLMARFDITVPMSTLDIPYGRTIVSGRHLTDQCGKLLNRFSG